jgi:hypothetical protein
MHNRGHRGRRTCLAATTKRRRRPSALVAGGGGVSYLPENSGPRRGARTFHQSLVGACGGKCRNLGIGRRRFQPTYVSASRGTLGPCAAHPPRRPPAFRLESHNSLPTFHYPAATRSARETRCDPPDSPAAGSSLAPSIPTEQSPAFSRACAPPPVTALYPPTPPPPSPSPPPPPPSSPATRRRRQPRWCG